MLLRKHWENRLLGVDTVKVDISTKTINLTYDPQKVTLAKFEGVLNDPGHTVAK
jgi:copper chaperone CopZ